MKHYTQLIRHEGNSDLFRAVEMSIVALSNNIPLHIHAEGLRGTGKTTIMRSAREMLPPILRVKNCIYNCHPESPHCPEHYHLSSQEIKGIGTELVPCPFLEISHAAKIGTVVGSIDLGKLTSRTQTMAAILPGTIPQAHRGIIFIDEINRLSDTSPELADVLLDVMGTKPGHIQIEETGLPTVELPVSVTIWAASNPDEEPGSLMRIRKQLADRFDYGITMGKPNDYQAVFNILKQGNKKELLVFDNKMNNIAGNLDNIIIEDHIRKIMAAIYVDFNLESLRAIETMEIAASLSCLMAERQKVELVDITHIIPLVLAHRLDNKTIVAILDYLKRINSGYSMNWADNYHHQSSREIQKNVEATETTEPVTWWKKIIENLYNKMSFLKKLRIGTGLQGTGQGTEIMSNGNMKMLDPAKLNLTAPKKKALPIRELPIEEFISREEHKKNDR